MNLILEFILVFFFCNGVIALFYILWLEIEEWYLGKDLFLPQIIYDSSLELVIYDRGNKEIIFYRFSKSICRISKHSVFYEYIPFLTTLYNREVRSAIIDVVGFDINFNELPINYSWNEVKFRNERDFLRQIQRIKG